MTVRAEIRPKMATHWAFLLWCVMGYLLGTFVAAPFPWWVDVVAALAVGIGCGEHAYRRDR